MYPDLRPQLMSIGHSSHTLEYFTALLGRHSIETVVDVRSSPYSRFNPQFNREPLRHRLEERGLRYCDHGRELGGRPAGKEFEGLKGRVLYDRVAEKDWFKSQLARLVDQATHSRVAAMCSEEDPAMCHRYLLITRVLYYQGVEVLHVREDGRLQATEEVPTFGKLESWSDQLSLL